MSEIKRKRLSLKTKKASTSSENEEEENAIKKRKIQSDKPTVVKHLSCKPKLDRIQENDSGNIDIIYLSDEEVIPVKQSKIKSEDKRKSLLDIQDEELRKLRIKLLELRKRQPIVTYVDLPQMPLADEQRKQIMYPREATPDTLLSSTDQDYSPLPQMCPACARRKPLHHDFSAIIETILNESKDKGINKETSDINKLENVSNNSSPETPLQVNLLADTKNDVPLPEFEVGDFGGDFSDVEETSIVSPRKHSKAVETISTTIKHNDLANISNNTVTPVQLDVPSTSDDDLWDDLSDFEETSIVSSRKHSKAVETKSTTKHTDFPKTSKNTVTPVQSDAPSTSAVSDLLDPDPKVSVLSTCPLCTMEFEKGTSQMDIDGHIAVCLSAAGDDVVW